MAHKPGRTSAAANVAMRQKKFVRRGSAGPGGLFLGCRSADSLRINDLKSWGLAAVCGLRREPRVCSLAWPAVAIVRPDRSRAEGTFWATRSHGHTGSVFPPLYAADLFRRALPSRSGLQTGGEDSTTPGGKPAKGEGFILRPAACRKNNPSAATQPTLMAIVAKGQLSRSGGKVQRGILGQGGARSHL